jgi:hypothetical protein
MAEILRLQADPEYDARESPGGIHFGPPSTWSVGATCKEGLK